MPPSYSAKILKDMGPHFGHYPPPTQYMALPIRKFWNCPAHVLSAEKFNFIEDDGTPLSCKVITYYH